MKRWTGLLFLVFALLILVAIWLLGEERPSPELLQETLSPTVPEPVSMHPAVPESLTTISPATQEPSVVVANTEEEPPPPPDRQEPVPAVDKFSGASVLLKVHGWVVNEGLGGLPDATVKLFSHELQIGEARSDSQGAYKILLSRRPELPLKIIASLPKRTSQRRFIVPSELYSKLGTRTEEFTPLDAQQDVLRLDLQLRTGAKLSGRINFENGDPAAGAKIFFPTRSIKDLASLLDRKETSANANMFDYCLPVVLTTNAEGLYATESLPANELLNVVVVHPEAIQALKEPWLLSADVPSSKDIVLMRAATLRGIVLDAEGKPVSQARVEITALPTKLPLRKIFCEAADLERLPSSGARSTRTDEKGRFAVRNLNPESEILIFINKAHTRASLETPDEEFEFVIPSTGHNLEIKRK